MEDNNLEDLAKKLEESEKLRDEYLAGWQRARADFLNYKREELARIDELMHYAVEGLVVRILPVLDNLYLAEKSLAEDLKKNPGVEGMLRIKDQFLTFLKTEGVEQTGGLCEKFDPNFQEIAGEVEVKDKGPGIVVEIVQNGYRLNGKLLRPAKVKVAK